MDLNFVLNHKAIAEGKFLLSFKRVAGRGKHKDVDYAWHHAAIYSGDNARSDLDSRPTFIRIDSSGTEY